MLLLNFKGKCVVITSQSTGKWHFKKKKKSFVCPSICLSVCTLSLFGVVSFCLQKCNSQKLSFVEPDHKKIFDRIRTFYMLFLFDLIVLFPLIFTPFSQYLQQHSVRNPNRNHIMQFSINMVCNKLKPSPNSPRLLGVDV